jgi:hypothetical protein
MVLLKVTVQWIDGPYTFEMEVPSQTESDVRYLMSEEDDDDIQWDQVKVVLLKAATPGTSDHKNIRLYPVTGVEVEGGW